MAEATARARARQQRQPGTHGNQAFVQQLFAEQDHPSGGESWREAEVQEKLVLRVDREARRSKAGAGAENAGPTRNERLQADAERYKGQHRSPWHGGQMERSLLTELGC